MSNTKHTPGPWTYAGGDNASCEINIGETTASVDRMEKNTGEYVIERDEMQANAKLIAAAPELLELIQWICKVTNSPEIGIRCDKAIKKATE